MKNAILSLLFICTVLLTTGQNETTEKGAVIAFGSCNKHNLDQPLWKEISLTRPDLFIWMGDNIYGDTENMKTMAKKYAKQKSREDYADFISKVKVVGTWDDHDYGANDAGEEFPKKKESRDLALNFLDVPKDNPVWEREGMYQSYFLEEENIKVILLDTRYFRNPLLIENGKIRASREGDILGDDQWAWLNEELNKNEGQKLTLIVSSIQVIPVEHPYEKWGNFPGARQRLFDILTASGLENVVFLSGDRHMGEISAMEYKGRNYYEVTSSGLTHVWEDMPPEKNRYRRGNVIRELNYGLIELQKRENMDDIAILQIRGKDKRQLLSLTIELK